MLQDGAFAEPKPDAADPMASAYCLNAGTSPNGARSIVLKAAAVVVNACGKFTARG